MTTDPEETTDMDYWAGIARQDFMDEVVAKAGKVKDVTSWMNRHYKKAGYKRLSRILLEMVR